MPRLILASQSPRRRELLRPIAAALGLPDFLVRPSAFDEAAVSVREPAALVRRLAFEKARAVRAAGAAPGDWIIGCDTVVVLDGRALGKPRDREAAGRMLTALSGRTHSVLSGVCVLSGGAAGPAGALVRPFPMLLAETRVVFFPLSPAEIAAYTATDEPYDKAGGYGIQGRAGLFVDRIEGDYNNVVGLPSARLYRLLRELLAKESENL